MRIEGVIQPGERLDVKRFYLPGVRIFSNCTCGQEVEWLGDYLGYPRVGQPHEIYFWHACSDQDREWTETVVLQVSVTTPLGPALEAGRQAAAIIKALWTDLRSRSGFDGTFDTTDDDTLDEMASMHEGLIRKILGT